MATHEGPELDARPRGAARRDVGRGRRHLHQLPAPRAAHPPRGARARRRARRAGSWRPALLRAAGRAARRHLRRARCSALVARRCPTTPASTTRAVGATGRVLPPADGARPPQEAQGLMAATRVVTVDRNTQAGRRPDPARAWPSPSRTWSRRCSARQASTIQFPEQKRNDLRPLPRHPHPHPARWTARPSAWPATCARRSAPPSASTSRPGERPESDIEKYPTRFEIDLLRCVYCGFCVDACPEEAIIMSRENDLVGTTRAELDHRPRPADGPRQARRVRRRATAPTSTTCAGRCASPPSSG